MPRLRLSHRIAILFILLGVMILLGIMIVANIPQPITIEDKKGDASILFESQNRLIVTEQGCYTVSWQVEGIAGVYLNDVGKIGQGEEALCYQDEWRAQLHVEFTDDTDGYYYIEPIIVQHQLSFWIALSVATICFLFGSYFLLAPWLGSRIRDRRAFLRNLRKITTITLVSLIVVLSILEVAMRFYFTNYGSEEQRISYVYSREDIQEKVVQFVGAPYITFVPNPNYIGHNTLGYRGNETTVEKPEGIYRIVTIGESTTYGFGVNANQAYPAVLEDTLQEDYGYTNVEVINAGVIGYTSFEVLSSFQYRVLDLDPDLIIYYGALNDADSRMEDPGCYNDPSPLRGLTTKHGLWRTEYQTLPWSVLYRYFAINTGVMNVPVGVEFALADIPIAEECLSGKDYTDAELIELNQPIFAERNFRNLLALAQFHDIEVMVSEFIFPTELEQVEGDENLIMKPARMQAVREIDALYRSIAEEMGAYYYPMGDDYVIEPRNFWTVVHMRPSGTEKQGELYAKYLVENNIIPQPAD